MSLSHHMRAQPAQAAGSLLSFVVGQDKNGRWVAVESHGFGGGLFRSRQDAIAFAEFETAYRPDGVRLSVTKIDLFQ